MFKIYQCYVIAIIIIISFSFYAMETVLAKISDMFVNNKSIENVSTFKECMIYSKYIMVVLTAVRTKITDVSFE